MCSCGRWAHSCVHVGSSKCFCGSAGKRRKAARARAQEQGSRAQVRLRPPGLLCCLQAGEGTRALQGFSRSAAAKRHGAGCDREASGHAFPGVRLAESRERGLCLTAQSAKPCNPGSGGLQGAGYCEHQVLPGQASQGHGVYRPAGCSPAVTLRLPWPSSSATPWSDAGRSSAENFHPCADVFWFAAIFNPLDSRRHYSDEVRRLTDSV